MATTPAPGLTGAEDAVDPAQVLLLLWRQRFVHRALLFPTAQSHLLAYDGPARRVLHLSASSAQDAEEARRVLTSHLKNLQGIAVTVVMFDRNFTAYRISRNPPEFGGMDAWVLKIFANHLNFTPVVIDTSDGRQYGYHYDNGTFTGTYADMVEGRAALAFNGHFVLDYNTRAVTPSSSVDFDALCILTPASDRLPTYEAMWHALGPTLLLGFVCTSSALVLLFNWLKSYRPRAEQRFRPCFVSVVLFGASASALPTASWQRIFIGTCALFSVLYVTLFQATVATAIFNPGSYPEIDTLEELDKRGLHMYTASDSLASTTFSDDNIIQKRLGKKVHVLLVQDNWDKIFRHRTAASMTRRSSYVPKPKQHLVKECPRQYFISYMVPYGSPLLKSLNIVINRLHAGGILGLLLKRSVDPNADGTTYQKSTDRDQAFDLEDLLGAFMFLLAGLTLSLIVFLLEKLLHGRFRRGEAESQDRCVDLDIDTELYRQWWQRQGGNKEAVQGGDSVNGSRPSPSPSSP